MADEQKIFEKGLALFSKKKYQEALNYFHALKSKSLEVMQAYYLGLTYVQLGKFEKALSWYRKVREIPAKVQGVEYDRVMYGLYINMGSVFQVLGKKEGLKYYQEAKLCYQNALEIQDTDERVWNNLGNVYLELNEYEKAIDAFKHALELNPEYPEAFYCLSLAYEYTNQYEKAIKQLETELKWKARNKIVLNRLTGLLFGIGDYDKARVYAEKVVEYYPENIDALKNLALILYNLQEYGQAYQVYQQILQINPKFTPPPETKSIFKEIQKKGDNL